jgi:hypothetical protein
MTAMPKTRFATTDDGASIAYQVLGQGEQIIVVIHPWASHPEVYWEQPRFVRFMLVFEDRGEHALKGVPEQWRPYAALQ